MGHHEFKETDPTSHQALELIFSPVHDCNLSGDFGKISAQPDDHTIQYAYNSWIKKTIAKTIDCL